MPYWSPLSENLAPSYQQLVTEMRALKDARRLTYKQLGRLTHYSHASWERWLNGKRPVSRSALSSLIEVTGADGARLQKLFDEAFASATVRSSTTAAVTPPVPSKPVPRLLPSDTRVFAGRGAEVTAVDSLIAEGTSAASGGAATVVVVQGMAGIGKTALAVHVAHRLRDRFPDGQLFLDLHGYTDSLAPVTAQSALDSLLRSLDASAAVPNGLQERAARLRDLLAGSRTLLVLDNARDAAQVRPLIPASSGCAVIVTSRSGLPALLGVGRVEVGSLPEDASRALLAALVGAGRVAADPAGVAKILEHCSGLPLALGIVGARLASRPSWSPTMLSERLDDQRRRLDELRVGDLAVRTAFRTGYESLVEAEPESSAATAFLLFGLVPGGDVSVTAFAALCGTDVVDAEAMLEKLVDARLVDSCGPGRYGLHDLLRLYATELAVPGLDADVRRHAVDELALHYASVAVAATQIQAPGRKLHDLLELPRRTVSMPLPDVEAAVRWYEAERMNLRALAGLAGASPMVDEVLARLPWLLQPFFYFRTRWDDWSAFAHVGLEAAKRLNSGTLQGFCYSSLAFLAYEQGLLDEATEWSRTGIAAAEARDDPAGRAAAQEPLAFVHIARGEIAEARGLLEQVLAFRSGRDYDFGLAGILNNLGNACFLMDDMEAARKHLDRGLDVCRDSGDLYNESYLRCSLGEMHVLTGEYEAALEQLSASIVMMRETTDERAEAIALDLSAQAHLALGDRDAARQAWEAAAGILTRLKHPRAESMYGELRRLAVGGVPPLDSTAGVRAA